jgi:epoxyqueuosine reductase
MLAMNYKSQEARVRGQEGGGVHGRVSCYAWGEDYHALLRRRLDELLAWLQREVPGCRGRGVVDTAPLLERDFARLAGLGWFGKNTMLLNKRLGSYFFLGALLVDIPLRPDPPFEASHCGTCTACLDACPTQAFVGPGQLDARRCISYLTIELRGPVPPELREPMGDWVFGCDVCQDVCPWNRKAPPAREPAFRPRPELDSPDLTELLRLSPDEFRRRFRGTALTRAKRRGLLRNAAIALGNSGDPRAVPVLVEALGDEEPLVRGAAAWALGRLGTDAARAALATRREVEPDATVRAELDSALAACAH